MRNVVEVGFQEHFEVGGDVEKGIMNRVVGMIFPKQQHKMLKASYNGGPRTS